eukprot:snap_masked-scaffold_10-processed-gene-10.22-mRNA-1 protein AED:0.04 eAED:0.04 QI:0/-1/0/1/-1/1/1/0/153
MRTTIIRSKRLAEARGLQGARFFTKPAVVRHQVNDRKDLDSKNLFAVVGLAGSQYKVSPGAQLVVNKLDPEIYRVGKTVYFDNVLLIGDKNQTIIGRPTISNAQVKALVLEQAKDEKVVVFKHKRRKNHMKWNGFRRKITVLHIEDILPNMDN